MSAIEMPKPSAIIYYVFSIRDVKTNTFMTPYFQTHKAGAMRMFADLATDNQSLISKHPADFQLYELGCFDSESALLVPHEQPQFISQATDFLTQ